MAIQVAFVLASRDFYGIEIGTISGIMRDAAPSTRWEEWAPCDATWCYNQDLTADITDVVLDYTQDGFEYANAWTSGSGIYGDRVGFEDETIFKYVFPSPTNITSVELTYNATGDVAGASAYLFINGVFSSAIPLSSGVNTALWDGLDNDVDFIMVGLDRVGLDRSAIGFSTNLKTTGTGSNPFGSSNC